MAQEIKNMASETMQRKAVLERKLAELLGACSRIEDLRIESLADPLDQMKSALDREMTMNHLDVQAQLLREVRAALKAIDEGTYGFCESCDEPIPPKRLNAVPWAPRCVRCQMDVESQRQDHWSFLRNAA